MTELERLMQESQAPAPDMETALPPQEPQEERGSWLGAGMGAVLGGGIGFLTGGPAGAVAGGAIGAAGGLDWLDFLGRPVRTLIHTGDVGRAVESIWDKGQAAYEEDLVEDMFGSPEPMNMGPGFDVGDVGDFLLKLGVGIGTDPLSIINLGSLTKSGATAMNLGFKSLSALRQETNLARVAAKAAGVADDAVEEAASMAAQRVARSHNEGALAKELELALPEGSLGRLRDVTDDLARVDREAAAALDEGVDMAVEAAAQKRQILSDAFGEIQQQLHHGGLAPTFRERVARGQQAMLGFGAFWKNTHSVTWSGQAAADWVGGISDAVGDVAKQTALGQTAGKWLTSVREYMLNPVRAHAIEELNRQVGAVALEKGAALEGRVQKWWDTYHEMGLPADIEHNRAVLDLVGYSTVDSSYARRRVADAVKVLGDLPKEARVKIDELVSDYRNISSELLSWQQEHGVRISDLRQNVVAEQKKYLDVAAAKRQEIDTLAQEQNSARAIVDNIEHGAQSVQEVRNAQVRADYDNRVAATLEHNEFEKRYRAVARRHTEKGREGLRIMARVWQDEFGATEREFFEQVAPSISRKEAEAIADLQKAPLSAAPGKKGAEFHEPALTINDQLHLKEHGVIARDTRDVAALLSFAKKHPDWILPNGNPASTLTRETIGSVPLEKITYLKREQRLPSAEAGGIGSVEREADSLADALNKIDTLNDDRMVIKLSKLEEKGLKPAQIAERMNADPRFNMDGGLLANGKSVSGAGIEWTPELVERLQGKGGEVATAELKGGGMAVEKLTFRPPVKAKAPVAVEAKASEVVTGSPNTFNDVLAMREAAVSKEIEAYKREIGLNDAQAKRLQDLISKERSTSSFEKGLTDEQRSRLNEFFDGPLNHKDNPNSPFTWEFDNRYDPTELEPLFKGKLDDEDKAYLARSLASLLKDDVEKNINSDRYVWAFSAAKLLKENGATWMDVAKGIDKYTTANSGSQESKIEFAKLIADRVKKFFDESAVELPKGKEPRVSGEVRALPSQTPPSGSTSSAGRTISQSAGEVVTGANAAQTAARRAPTPEVFGALTKGGVTDAAEVAGVVEKLRAAKAMDAPAIKPMPPTPKLQKATGPVAGVTSAHLQTAEEFADAARKLARESSGTDAHVLTDKLTKAHQSAIGRAIEAGEFVPERVMRSYPEVQKMQPGGSLYEHNQRNLYSLSRYKSMSVVDYDAYVKANRTITKAQAKTAGNMLDIQNAEAQAARWKEIVDRTPEHVQCYLTPEAAADLVKKGDIAGTIQKNHSAIQRKYAELGRPLMPHEINDLLREEERAGRIFALGGKAPEKPATMKELLTAMRPSHATMLGVAKRMNPGASPEVLSRKADELLRMKMPERLRMLTKAYGQMFDENPAVLLQANLQSAVRRVTNHERIEGIRNLFARPLTKDSLTPDELAWRKDQNERIEAGLKEARKTGNKDLIAKLNAERYELDSYKLNAPDANGTRWMRAGSLDPSLQNYQIKEDVYRFFSQQIEMERNPLFHSAAMKTVMKYNGMWKAFQLSWPGSWFRDVLGNLVLRFQRDGFDAQTLGQAGPLLRILTSGGKAEKLKDITLRVGKETMTGEEFWGLALRNGVVGSNEVTVEIGRVLNSAAPGGRRSQAGTLRKVLRAYTEDIPGFFRDNERLAMFHARMAKGDSADRAASLVNEALYDYNRVSPAVDIARKTGLIPFATWASKNVPAQLDLLMRHPGQFAALMHARDALNDGAPGVSEQDLPEYVKGKFNVTFGKDAEGRVWFRCLSNIIPMTDLPDARAADYWTQMLGPVPKAGMEQLFNRDMFTGKDIERYDGQLAPVSFGGLAEATVPVRVKAAMKTVLGRPLSLADQIGEWSRGAQVEGLGREKGFMEYGAVVNAFTGLAPQASDPRLNFLMARAEKKAEVRAAYQEANRWRKRGRPDLAEQAIRRAREIQGTQIEAPED